MPMLRSTYYSINISICFILLLLLVLLLSSFSVLILMSDVKGRASFPREAVGGRRKDEVGTCEASRFDLNLNRTIRIRFDLKVMG